MMIIRTPLAATALLTAFSPVASQPAIHMPAPYTIAVVPGGGAGSPLDAGSPEFASDGTAYLRDGPTLTIVPRDGAPRTIDLGTVATDAINRDLMAGGRPWDGKWDQGDQVSNAVVVDASDRIYTLIVPRYSAFDHAVLLWSADAGQSWHAIALTGRDATIEKRDGFNDHAGPPTIVSYEYYGATSGPHLWLEPMGVTGGRVARDGPALLVSDHSLLVPNHSGGANSTFTTRDRIFVVYATTQTGGPGTAAAGRQYLRAERRFDGDEVALGHSLSAKGPDPHDMPGITADRGGTLRVVLPGHQAMLQMITAKRPGTMLAGWSAPEPFGEPRRNNQYGFYTYPSLNTAPDGTINVIARAEGTGYRFRLVQFQKKPGQPWTVWPNGVTERIVADPSRQSYVAWRQQATMDPAGRLYLNFRYFANQLTPTEVAAAGLTGVKPEGGCDRHGRCFFAHAPTVAPVTLVSYDQGTTWRRAAAARR